MTRGRSLRSRAGISLLLGLACVLTSCSGPLPSPSPPPVASSPASPTRPTSASPAAPSPSGSTVPPAGQSPALSTQAPLDLTVMSYNTLTGRNDCSGCKALKRAGFGAELKLSRRMPAAAKKVLLADPDIIGFQENEGPGRLPQAYLAPLLTGYTWVQPKRSVPIAVRTARFEVLESGVRTLEKGTVSCTKSDRTAGRFAVWAKLRERTTGREFWVFNTHLHPYDVASCARLRAKNVEKLLALTAEKNPGLALPQLVTGDFNAFGDERRRTFSAHLSGLGGAGMVDAAAVASSDASDVRKAASAGWMTAKVKGRTVPKAVSRTGRHIDYVWVPKGTRVTSWAVLSGPGVTYRKVNGVRIPVWTGVLPSDHSPVVARLTLPGR